MSRHFIIGWPGAGKTTFIAATYGVLLEAGAEAQVRLGRLGDEDHTYVCEIHDRWSKGLPIASTKEHGRQECILPLEGKSQQTSAHLVFMDVEGELFNNAFDERGLPEEIADLLANCDGVLLFLPAERTAEEAFAPIQTLDEAFAALDAKELGTVPAVAGPAPVEMWSSDAATMQCKAVDILQNIAADGRLRRLAVVLTKWDVLKPGDTGAARKFEQTYALVAQYLNNNKEIWRSAIFGVSAQGGELKALGNEVPLSNTRVYAVNDNGRAPFEAPLSWIVSFDGS
jgi:hypothetical protein